MLIDWVTARIPFTAVDESQWHDLRMLTERVMRFKPRPANDLTVFVDQTTGENLNSGYFLMDMTDIVYETAAWESIKSDSHQIAFRVGSDAVWIQGSPARIIGTGDAVFGEGASLALDLAGCVSRMIAFVSAKIDIPLNPDIKEWVVSRIDITGSLLLDSLADVRIALRVLRECEGGRYRVSQQAGDTVYWSHTSRLRAGKAYAKGPHIEYQMKKPDYKGRQYTHDEMLLINRLLRLELRLGAQFLRERIKTSWQLLTADDLTAEWRDYFHRMIGASEMSEINELLPRLEATANTKSQAKAAYSTFLLIQSLGWQHASEVIPKTSWYRHLGLLRQVGLGDADLSAGKIVQLRRKVLECQLVSTWSDIRLAA